MVEIGGETLLARAVRTANEAGLQPVLVVISKEAVLSAGTLMACKVLLNEAASEGMASSIRLGVTAAQAAEVDGVVVMACDQPAVTASHLSLLIADGVEVTASAYAERRGVPAYFPAKVFGELMKLRGDVGARELFKTARCVELKDGELDVDTLEELERARQLFG